MSHPSRRRRTTLLALALLPASLVTATTSASAAPAPATAPEFTRVNVDTGIQGASFTVVGEIFDGEQNLVTSGFGALGAGGLPVGGGTLQVYRPKANLADWRKVTVFDTTENVIFPNQPTLSDVDGDGDTDIIVPAGNFFESAGGVNRGSLTWWENTGPTTPFVRHNILTGQAWSYHGVQHVDFDGDGIRDIITVGEQGRVAGNLTDDDVQTQFLKGKADLTFEAPVSLGDVGGSLPVVHDVDGDGELDIITSQYFDVGSGAADAGRATFLWLERGDDGVPGLSADDFTPHTIATLDDTPAGGRGVGQGFQIRPVPDFRAPGTVSWIGTNHTNRCVLPILASEQVLEFLPPADPTQQWTLNTLSTPATSTPDCTDDFRNNLLPIFPGEDITSRATYGQGAPGVFGYGDIDGDGDVDLAVSGDGDRRLFWIEQLADGKTLQHTLTAPGEEFGQAGGAVVADLNGDQVAELVFSSFDRNALAIWRRTPVVKVEVPTTVTNTVKSETVRSALSVSTKRKGKAKRTTYAVRLDAATGGPARRVKVVFDPARGKTKVLRTLTVRGKNGDFAGSFSWRAPRRGTLRFTYAGTTLSPTLRDTAARTVVKVSR
ncbi:MAG TPA: VCBS repeat-containing protein [Nocardioides sp.]|uniref:FG-GAP repeat domain-containing protein n=1 Tax=Nocardioides sp. TaxID=35761 RepID=UPI002BC82A56|nr:VCBS repeat-containing protein [Nocardioides sp.]HTW13652.1 VCBS repeat-containing protein [Nocardioides sp.]